MRITYLILFFISIFNCRAGMPRILFNIDSNDNFYKSSFENLDDENIDSIEIKLVNWDNTDVNYCIKRSSFDQTFAELYSKENKKHNIIYLKILDKVSISLFSIIINYTLIPYPQEGVILYPNEILEMELLNNPLKNINNLDPLEIRGKITFYIKNGEPIDAFLSRMSIDICNYRYSIGNTLSYFLSKLGQI